MRLRVDRVFLAQAAAYKLAVGCEECAHFNSDEAPSGGCAHGYPNAHHVSEAFAREGQEASFCKEWELA